jgi:hypothetical protein
MNRHEATNSWPPSLRQHHTTLCSLSSRYRELALIFYRIHLAKFKLGRRCSYYMSIHIASCYEESLPATATVISGVDGHCKISYGSYHTFEALLVQTKYLSLRRRLQIAHCIVVQTRHHPSTSNIRRAHASVAWKTESVLWWFSSSSSRDLDQFPDILMSSPPS